MKSVMKARQGIYRSRHEGGFALIATLLVSSLLVLLVMALLSLSTMTQRQSSSAVAREQARANAKLAFSLAMGELQRAVGPDQRITAPAAIRDTNPATAAIDGVRHPQSTGVWRSRDNSPDNLPTDYKAEKDKLFLRWLVSGLTDAQAGNADLFNSSSGDPLAANAVELVGKGTVGTAAAASKSVRAGKVTIQPSGRPAAGLAYAVMDEGAKARINLPVTDKSRLTSNAVRMAVTGNPARMAVEKADATLAPLGDTPEKRAGQQRLPNIETSGLHGGGGGDIAKPYFHDITTDSAGVLADVVKGGLRKDLSTMFEMNSLPADYASRYIYSDSGTPVGPQDPPWNLPFQFSKLYKSTFGSSLADGFSVNDTVGGFNLGTIAMDGTPQVVATPQNSLPLAPVLARCEVVYSMTFWSQNHPEWRDRAFAGESGWVHRAIMVYQPIVTLWNPYNVPLRLENACVFIEDPPVGFKIRRMNGTRPGYLHRDFVPVNQLYGWNANEKKVFALRLFNNIPSGTANERMVVLQPGEVKIFSPTTVMESDWNNAFNGVKGRIIDAAPGWRGWQYGFQADWLVPQAYYANNSTSGPREWIALLCARDNDQFDIETTPIQQPGINSTRVACTLATESGGSFKILSRLEFNYAVNPTATLRSSMSSAGPYPVAFPLKLTDYAAPIDASQHWLPVVQPVVSLSAQGKTSLDSQFPSRPWIHGNLSRPLLQIDLSNEKQAWQSHEMVLRPMTGATDSSVAIDTNNRGRFVSGLRTNTGTTFASTREAPMLPVQGVAQLAQANLAGAGPLLPNVDHAVGQSFAHPLVNPAKVKSVAGNAVRLDHSYHANDRLWDSWYASTLASYTGRTFGTGSRTFQQVSEDFFKNRVPLLNPRLVPWFSSAGASQSALAAIVSGANPTATAYTKAAAFQMLLGAFNVNSTSKEAWKALLASLNGDPALLYAPRDANAMTFQYDTGSIAAAGTYFSKTRLPNVPPPGRASIGDSRWQLWQGARELTDKELDDLAYGIIREVKRRGPFLSLAEFVNRQVKTPATTAKSLYLMGALQNAIEEAADATGRTYNLNLEGGGPAPTLISQYSKNITHDEVKDYYTTALDCDADAATGATAIGAAASLDQLSILTQIGSSLSARSDTFKVRFYGDTMDATGTKIRARAYGEAVLQRVPDYVDAAQVTGNTADAPPGALNPANQRFGRRFTMVSFRWLAADEI